MSFKRDPRPPGDVPPGNGPTLPLGWGQYPHNDPAWRYPLWGENRTHYIARAILISELTTDDAESFLADRGHSGTVTSSGEGAVRSITVGGTEVAYIENGAAWWRLGDWTYDASVAVGLTAPTISYLNTAAGDPLVTPDGDRLYVET